MFFQPEYLFDADLWPQILSHRDGKRLSASMAEISCSWIASETSGHN